LLRSPLRRSRSTGSRNGLAEKLKPYARNARLDGAEQIAQLRGSFRQFGQVWPMLVRAAGTIIAGHGRLDAAKAEGFKTIRVIVAKGWSDEQCRAFGLLDNVSRSMRSGTRNCWGWS
jgi:ParB-like chromosome segregation protein Spo0J